MSKDDFSILVLGADERQALLDLSSFADYNNKELKKLNENLKEIGNAIQELDGTFREIYKFIQLNGGFR